jgi:hypothetical protein
MHHHEKPTYREDCAKAGMCPAVLAFNTTTPVYCDVAPEEHDRNWMGLVLHRGTRFDGADVPWTNYDTMVVP